MPPTPAPVLGDTRTRPADGMVMLYVPAGQFEMGSDRYAIQYARQLCREYGGDTAIATCGQAVFTNEGPKHLVTLDGFWIDRTEASQRAIPPLRNGRRLRAAPGARLCTPLLLWGQRL
jgi:formylglycine-generating enzyme required for sulfatase activity